LRYIKSGKFGKINDKGDKGQ
jgi:hypothetical protein